MPPSNPASFWVIFDTCTIPDYYQDVHNLIAVPGGSVLRYEYRDKYLSAEALSAARDPARAPSRVLLVYAQWNKYVRGDKSPGPSAPSAEMVWVATRFADMLLIPPAAGEHYFFDFKVLDYPKVDDAALSRILTPLAAAGEVPYRKWVAVSHESEALAALQGGEESANWQAIVNRLGTEPMQFEQDSFLRLRGPFRDTKLIQPTYVREKQEGEVRKVRSVYEVNQDDRLSFEIQSHTPYASRRDGDSKFNRALEVKVNEKAPLALTDNSVVELRQYTARTIELVAKGSDELGEKSALVTFETAKGEDDWPQGANFSVQFTVFKKVSEILFGMVFGLIALVSGAFAVKAWDKYPLPAIFLAVLGGLSAVAAGILLWRKISFKVS